MDIFYEESAANSNAQRGAKLYTIFDVLSKICGVLGFGLAVATVLSIPTCSTEGFSPEQLEAYQLAKTLCRITLIGALFFLGIFLYFSYVKGLCNVSYDYVFVSGELRISKVFNLNKRKLITIIDSNDVLQIGRVDSNSFERLSADSSIRQVVCTPNRETTEGKDFIYILAAQNGKQLYIIECRELLVAYMLKFLKRTTLADDYTSSKQGRV